MASAEETQRKKKEQEERLNEILGDVDLSDQEMADELGISTASLKKWRSGHNHMSCIAWSAMILLAENHRLKKIIQHIEQVKNEH